MFFPSRGWKFIIRLIVVRGCAIFSLAYLFDDDEGWWTVRDISVFQMKQGQFPSIFKGLKMSFFFRSLSPFLAFWRNCLAAATKKRENLCHNTKVFGCRCNLGLDEGDYSNGWLWQISSTCCYSDYRDEWANIEWAKSADFFFFFWPADFVGVDGGQSSCLVDGGSRVVHGRIRVKE